MLKERIMANGLFIICWPVRMANATAQRMNANTATPFLVLISWCFFIPTRFTDANMSKKPALPAVDMLSRSSVLERIRVASVMKRSPMGLPQSKRGNSLGSSFSSATSWFTRLPPINISNDRTK